MSSLRKLLNENSGNTLVEKILGTLSESTVPRNELPVDVEIDVWVTLSNPERIVRKFLFGNYEKMKYFLDELLSYQEHIGHHAKILINHHSVHVETFTVDLDEVTDQDLKLARFCDEIYEDINYFKK